MQYQDLDDSAPRPAVQNGKKWLLNCFQMASPTHHNPGGWKHPADKSSNYHDISFWTELAQILERGKFHGIFSTLRGFLFCRVAPRLTASFVQQLLMR